LDHEVYHESYPRSPPSAHLISISKRPRLSTIPSGKVATRAQSTRSRLDDLFFPSPQHTKSTEVSYKIPQLRGLSLEDPPVDDQDTCEACYDTTSLRSMKRLTPCHVSFHLPGLCVDKLMSSTTSVVDVSVPHWGVCPKTTLLPAARNV